MILNRNKKLEVNYTSMDKIFHPDNPVMRFLTWFCNMMYINILFILTSIPIITIGASLSGMYTCCMKLIRGEESYIWKDFFKAFKENFKQATLLWLVALMLCGIWFGNLYILFHMLGGKMVYLQIPIWILLFITFSILLYAFPLLSQYENSTKQLVKNAILLAIANFPTTLMLLVIHLIPVFYCAFSLENVIRAASVLCFFGFALIAFVSSFFINHILKKLEDDKDEAFSQK